MQKDYKGDFSAEVLPNDRARIRRRYGMNWGHYNRDGSLLGGLNLNKARTTVISSMSHAHQHRFSDQPASRGLFDLQRQVVGHGELLCRRRGYSASSTCRPG